MKALTQREKEEDLERFDNLQSRISDQIISLVNGKMQDLDTTDLDYKKNQLLTSVRELENLVRGYL